LVTTGSPNATASGTEFSISMDRLRFDAGLIHNTTSSARNSSIFKHLDSQAT
jgi:hypothetical protein